jgi:Tfp pilus assembly ATPase PilU
VTEKIVGSDTDKDGWTTEIVGEIQPDGSLLIVGEHRYRTTIDHLMAEQEAGRLRQEKAKGLFHCP